jgi:hypothetical protein
VLVACSLASSSWISNGIAFQISVDTWPGRTGADFDDDDPFGLLDSRLVDDRLLSLLLLPLDLESLLFESLFFESLLLLLLDLLFEEEGDVESSAGGGGGSALLSRLDFTLAKETTSMSGGPNATGFIIATPYIVGMAKCMGVSVSHILKISFDTTVIANHFFECFVIWESTEHVCLVSE